MQQRLRCFPALLIVVAIAANLAIPAQATDVIEGVVTKVRDVDTIEIGDIAIRLQGVDGPEVREAMGLEARRFMKALVEGKRVSCQPDGTRTYDRIVAVCFDSEGRDIGGLAIAAGFARDCPRFSGGRYAALEVEQSRQLPAHSYCDKR